MHNTEYYLNRQEFGDQCIPTRHDRHLDVNNHLSEFTTEDDKSEVRDNLGITDIVNELNQKIDNKVIESADISWDIKPTMGNVNQVLSSNTIYNTLLKYALRKEVDHHIQEIWLNTRRELAKLYNNVECEINQLNKSLKDYIDEIKCNFSNGLLENKITVLEQAIESLARTGKNGTLILDTFGDKSYATMSQKAITNAINNLWKYIEEITGDSTHGLSITASREFFIRGTEQAITIRVYATNTIDSFEHVELYANDVLIGEDYNTNDLEVTINATDTTIIRCKAKIMGNVYTATKTIACLDNFFLLTGQFENAIEAMDVAYNSNLYSIPITETLRLNKDISCEEGDHIVVIMPKSLQPLFQRLDMNGIEIPCIEYELNTYSEDGGDYIVYISKNAYSQGTYNIDING